MKSHSFLLIPFILGTSQLLATDSSTVVSSYAAYKHDSFSWINQKTDCGEMCILNVSAPTSSSIDLSEMTKQVKKRIVKKKRAKKIKKISKKKPEPKTIPIEDEKLSINFSDDRNQILLSGKSEIKLNYLITDQSGRRVAHGPLWSNSFDLPNLASNNYTISIYDKNVKVWSSNFSK